MQRDKPSRKAVRELAMKFQHEKTINRKGFAENSYSDVENAQKPLPVHISKPAKNSSLHTSDIYLEDNPSSAWNKKVLNPNSVFWQLHLKYREEIAKFIEST